jgi:hypothetical protein
VVFEFPSCEYKLSQKEAVSLVRRLSPEGNSMNEFSLVKMPTLVIACRVLKLIAIWLWHGGLICHLMGTFLVNECHNLYSVVVET